MVFTAIRKSIFGQMRELCAGLFSSLRMSAFAALVLLIFAGVLAHQLGVLQEDIQVVLFPFFCFLLFVLPVQRHFRPPLALISLAVFLWLSSVVYSHVIQPRAESDVPYFSVSRLDSDGGGVFVRQMSKRYDTISGTHDLPPLRVVVQSLDSTLLAQEWLREGSPRQLFVVSGASSWLQIVFNPDIRWSSKAEFLRRLDPDLGSANSLANIETVPFKVQWVPRPLLLATLPRSIDSPAGGSKEFVLHALGWLSKALSTHLSSNSTNDLVDPGTADALAQLSADSRIGLSNGIAAIGQYLQALVLLAEYQSQGSVGDEIIDRAIALFRDAARFVKMESNPELFSVVFNNAGVALMAVADTPEELYKARFWIRVAHDASAFGDTLPTGSQVAMENLLRLDEAEIVAP